MGVMTPADARVFTPPLTPPRKGEGNRSSMFTVLAPEIPGARDMFQTYDPPEARQSGAERVEKLRRLMAKAGLDAVLVPRADEHQGEYVAPSAERLKWLTGFSGSAGLAVVGRTAAALLVDGRYVVQAPSQVDTRTFEVLQIPQAKLDEWLGKHLKAGGVVGFDPRLHTAAMIEELAKSLQPKGIKLKALASNPVDRVWGRERPPSARGAVIPHAMKYAGKAAEQKIAELQAALRKEGEDAVILTLPDSIAWLLNIRGSDVAHNPVALAFAIVPASGKLELFIDPAKIGPEAKAHLAPLAKISEPAALEPAADRAQGHGQAHPARSRDRLELVLPQARGRQGAHRAWAGPVPVAQGAQECGRDQGRALSQQARRGGRGPLPRLARPRGARRGARRDRRRAPARDHPQRDPGSQGDQLRHHLGRGPEWRHRPLPGDHRHQPQAGRRRALSRRLGRPVSRRHHRHHAYRRHRQADARDAGALHAGAEGAHRHRHGTVPQGHTRHRPRPVRAAGAVGGRPRLRPRHRPRRGQLPRLCTRARRASPSAA